MSKLVNLYNSFNGSGLQNDWTKARARTSKDQTPYSVGTIPGGSVATGFGNPDPAVLTDNKLKGGRKGELGSDPKPTPGVNPPGYGPGEREYSKKVQK